LIFDPTRYFVYRVHPGENSDPAGAVRKGVFAAHGHFTSNRHHANVMKCERFGSTKMAQTRGRLSIIYVLFKFGTQKLY
jgi:hypothetical protein